MPTEMREYVVTQSQALIQAAYAMTVMEQRLLLACISQVDSRLPMPENNTYTLTVEQAKDLFFTNENAQNVYRDMARAVEKLYERDVKIQLPDNETLQTRFVSAIVWSPDKYQITLTFASKIRPYLSELRNNFVGYKLKNVVQLTSSYAIRLYEKLVGWALQGQYYKEMEIAEFREMLAIGDKYKQIGELKKRVIELAVEQINANTDFTLDVSFKKCKREVRWIQLRFNQKAEAKAADLEAKQQRKARAIQNQAAKQNRLIDEQKTVAKRTNAALIEAERVQWENTPVGAKFFRVSDNSEWVKDDGGSLFCAKLRASIPVSHVPALLAEGKFDKQTDNQSAIVPVDLDDEEWIAKDFLDWAEEKNEETQEQIQAQIEFSIKEQKMIALYERGIISKDEFFDFIFGGSKPPKDDE